MSPPRRKSASAVDPSPGFDSGGAGGNPGKADPKGTLEDGVRGDNTRAGPGDPYSVGRNVRRDYVRLPERHPASWHAEFVALPLQVEDAN